MGAEFSHTCMSDCFAGNRLMISDSVTECGNESENDSERGNEIVRKEKKTSHSLIGYKGESALTLKENEHILSIHSSFPAEDG